MLKDGSRCVPGSRTSAETRAREAGLGRLVQLCCDDVHTVALLPASFDVKVLSEGLPDASGAQCRLINPTSCTASSEGAVHHDSGHGTNPELLCPTRDLWVMHV